MSSKLWAAAPAWWPLGLALALAAPASAATYKCTVDGKTVYQQTPCEAGASSETLRIQSAPDRGSVGAADGARMQQQIRREGVRLARDGFDRLKSGRIDEYVANLCPRERQSFNNPTIKGSLKSEGARLATAKVQMAPEPREVGVQSLTFDAYEDPFGPSDSRVPPKRIRVNVDIGRDLGQLCLRAMSFWSGS